MTMIMPATSMVCGWLPYFAGKYPGSVGWLMAPGYFNPRVPPYLPYAVDNGCFKGFDPDPYWRMLRKLTLMKPPLWVVVPDVLGNSRETLVYWHMYRERVRSYGFKRLAFVAQDGCEPGDVPSDAYCIFIGGSTRWKLQNAHRFKGSAPWFHVGRVNSPERYHWAKRIGAHSCDGSGWFRTWKNCLRFAELFEPRQRNLAGFTTY